MRWGGVITFSCTCTPWWCYATRSSPAFGVMWGGVIMFNLMLRCKIFSTVCSNAWCYAVRSSLPSAATPDALSTILLLTSAVSPQTLFVRSEGVKEPKTADVFLRSPILLFFSNGKMNIVIKSTVHPAEAWFGTWMFKRRGQNHTTWTKIEFPVIEDINHEDTNSHAEKNAANTRGAQSWIQKKR